MLRVHTDGGKDDDNVIDTDCKYSNGLTMTLTVAMTLNLTMKRKIK